MADANGFDPGFTPGVFPGTETTPDIINEAYHIKSVQEAAKATPTDYFTNIFKRAATYDRVWGDYLS